MNRHQLIWENYLLDKGHPQNRHEAAWEEHFSKKGHPNDLRAEWEEFYAKRGLDLYGRPLR